MILPENGSVVVIDDDPNQARPIIDALAKKGIATTYFRGTGEKEVPNEPLKNVRLAILDLQLNPMDKDPHTIATRLVNVLNRVISDDNGPFMVLIWSRKDNLFGEEFRSEVKKQENSRVPICIANIEKAKCLQISETTKDAELADSVIKDLKTVIEENDLEAISKAIINNFQEDEQFEATPNAVEVIEESLKNALERAGVFHLFVMWENLIRKASYQTVNDVSAAIEYSDLWEMNMRDILKRLAKARTGKNTLSNEFALKAALYTFSGSFYEELELEIRKKIGFPEYIQLESPFSIAGKLNDDIFKIDIYLDGKADKVRLFKNDQIYKGKDGIGYAKISSLSDGLENTENDFINNLIKCYQEIPLLVNSKLHLEENPSAGHMPGNVYKIEVPEERKNEILLTYFDKIPDDPSDYHFIELEVSPLCDYAHHKWEKSRLLPGLLFPEREKLKRAEYFYQNSPVLLLDKKKYKMAFCYLIFKSGDIKVVQERGKPWFRIKREMLQDIVTKLSGHINRSGITIIE